VIRSLFLYLSRIIMAVILIVSTVYCVLCFVPFTNQNLIQSDLLEWLPVFVRSLPILFTAAALLWVVTLHPRFRVSRFVAGTTVAMLTAFAVWLWMKTPLAHLGMDPTTLSTGHTFLALMGLLALLDISDAGAKIRWLESPRSEPLRMTIAVMVAAAGVAVMFLAIGFHRAPVGLVDDSARWVIILDAVWTQLLIGALALVALLVFRTLTILISLPAHIELSVIALVAWAAVARMIVVVVFTPLAFSGVEATWFAILLSGAMVLSIIGLALRQRAQRKDAIADSGPDVALGGIGLPPGGHWAIYVVGLIAIVVGIVFAELALAQFDWDFLLQKLVAVAAWVLFGGLLYRIAGRLTSQRDLTVTGLLIALAALAGFATLPAQTSGLAASVDTQQVADDWRGFDAAFRLTHDATEKKLPTNVEEIYSFLRANTNISRARTTNPADVTLVDPLEATSEQKPDIYMIVIDSLRRDYISSFNPEVTFTPNIAAVANEGIAFQNTFTHYGATGLAEPSIWVGGLMLHKQYVEPFHPMNALEKLLEAEKYRIFLGNDPILFAITREGPRVTKLPKAGINQDLCGELKELQQRVAALPPDSGPVFSYHQPLNVHISSINREGPRIPAGESYPGFDEPRAWRIRRMDACIGDFVSFLKQQNRWDNTILIVTSDHGDSLGEGGRWGHAYTITPEVIRIPLVMHLPERYRSLQSDPMQLVFSSDITPSLYALLGHTEIANDEMYGRPLFTPALEDQIPYLRSDYLIASSYGPVYGILSKQGRQLFIADSVNFRDSVWDIPLNGKPDERRPNLEETVEAYARMRELVDHVAKFYDFDYNAGN